MLIGDVTPQLMPVPQAVTMIQSPSPMMQVMPASFQPAPYFPATIIPAGSTTPLEFVPVNLPQLLMSAQSPFQQVIQQPASPAQQPISVTVGGDKPVSVNIGQQAMPQTVIPYMVAGRTGGMVAAGSLSGLDDSNSAIFLGALVLATVLIFGRKK